MKTYTLCKNNRKDKEKQHNIHVNIESPKNMYITYKRIEMIKKNNITYIPKLDYQNMHAIYKKIEMIKKNNITDMSASHVRYIYKI